MKEITIVFNKESDSKLVQQQKNFISKWCRNKYIWCGHYKDKTMQARAVGEHVLLKVDDDQLEKVKALIGTPFTYETRDQFQRQLIHTFDLMVDPELGAYANGSVVNTTEEYDLLIAEFEKSITARQKVKVDRMEIHFNNVRPRKEAPNSFKEWVTVTTEVDAVFEVEAMLTDEGLNSAMEDKSANPRVTELTKLIDETCDLFNKANNACGRIGWIRKEQMADWKDKDQLEQYLIRERCDSKLITYRRELGKIKAAQTRAAKKGLDNKVNFKKYSIV